MSMEMERKQSHPEAEPVAAASSPSQSGGAAVSVPEDALIIVPVRNMILFPGMILPLNIGRESTVAAAQQAARNERPIGLLLQRDPSNDNPGADDVHRAGTVAQILRYVTTPDGGHHLIVQGQERFVVREFLPGYPFLVARVERIADGAQASQDIEARFIPE